MRVYRYRSSDIVILRCLIIIFVLICTWENFYENRTKTTDRLGGTGTSSNGVLENRYVRYE